MEILIRSGISFLVIITLERTKMFPDRTYLLTTEWTDLLLAHQTPAIDAVPV